MFTRQHYKAIAEMLKEEIQPWPIKGPTFETVKEAEIRRGGINHTALSLSMKLADYFEADNPHFDRNKFMAACGID